MPPKPPIRISAKSARATRPPPYQPRPTTTPPPTHRHAPQSSPHTTSPPPIHPSSRNGSFFSHPFIRFLTYTTISASSLLWIRDNHLDYMRVCGESMAPTLNGSFHETGEKDIVLIRPYWDSAQKDKEEEGEGGLKRGDVVTFWKPRNARELGIKRVVGVGGDSVYPGSGYGFAAGKEGEEGEEREYLKGVPDGLSDYEDDSIASERRERGRIVVPYGHIWVEGDNARRTLDSRDNGPISRKLVVGRVVGVWRGSGFSKIGDERSEKERRMGSRVVEGRGAEVPDIFLE